LGKAWDLSPRVATAPIYKFMRQLSIEEISAIKAEVERLGSLDTAIKFCLGYACTTRWTNAMQDTFDWVKRQVLSHGA
jgi:hypothetical protein